MRYLTLSETLELYRQVMDQSGGAIGILNLDALESALAQPRMTFGGEELYPSIVEKASTLGFSLIKNHPFVDGNKRAGHAAMETFLVLNDHEIEASVDEEERVILKVASNEMTRAEFTDWPRAHVVEKESP
jgi:death-on-curing protein